MGFGSYDEGDQDSGEDKEVEGEDWTEKIKGEEADAEGDCNTEEIPEDDLKKYL